MERLRRLVRTVLPYNSGLYRLISRIYNLGYVAMRQGPTMAAALNRIEHTKSGAPEWLRFKGVEHPILARPGTPDVPALVTTLVREDHGYFSPSQAPGTILDAGAYIGDSAAYFLSKYPKATVIAMEPDPGNFEIARRNLERYGDRVRLLPDALSNKAGKVKFGGDYDGAGISDAGYEVPATTVPALMKMAGWDRIGILKMDIEGAEEFVLDESSDVWLPFVDMLILEIHGERIEERVRPVIERHGFQMTLYRTSWYCRRKL